ncbi:MBL fold metallo-hydrolase [Weissella diestrammenae]|uniref:MBL fold metallo-hydrolase n=1 Tax=Weissella diestrammenae TaxID=1162633 RepID=A0A7G9T6M8_9LACO|nr:MBL fold metallo-hydrolase [Weissella diestrammenae]MCM0582962.1 MBL fold metallo-hydrolase [Weissella diestrammenae]QNN75753.1 MBL fold metallo-hydrolase [Weissella diestrammenae]
MNDEFKVSMLASGSSGNVTYIETPEHKVLVDAGLSGKKIETLMQSIGRSLNDVDQLFVTHEHVDHIKGVGILARKYGMPVYANEKTWQVMSDKIGTINPEQKQIFEAGQTKLFGDLDVESFSVSHDAADPQFYLFHHANKTFAMLTDTGYVSGQVAGLINNADAILMEANHDVAMLRYGGYAWSLKQRILGDEGHLSNEDGALTLANIIGSNTKQVYLGHLSQENNQVPLAHLTVEQILQENDLGVNHDFSLFDTNPDRATTLASI